MHAYLSLVNCIKLDNLLIFIDRSNLNADLELAVDLVWKFGPLSVSQTVEQIYNFLTSLPVFISMFAQYCV